MFDSVDLSDIRNRRLEAHRISPRLGELGITYLGFYSNKTPNPYLHREHHETNYEICYLESGMQPYYIHTSMDDAEDTPNLYRVYGGETFITRPYELHSTGSFQQLRGCLYWIQLDVSCPTLLGHTPERVRMLTNALGSIQGHLVRFPQSVSSRLREAYHLILLPDEEHLFHACELLSLYILEMAEYCKKLRNEAHLNPSVSSKGIEAITYIQNHLLSPDLNLDTVAEHLHYSRSYAMKAFKKEIGLTIHEYILQSKINYACELLAAHSITETALLLNFSSSQHFSKIFREFTGITPGEYAASLQKTDSGHPL